MKDFIRVDESHDLSMKAAPITIGRSFFLMLSHRNAPKWHHQKLCAQLVADGANPNRIRVIYGDVLGEAWSPAGTMIKYNGITMWSVRHKWFMAAKQALCDFPNTTAVWYLENNAILESSLAQCVEDCNKSQIEIKWPGWRNLWPQSKRRFARGTHTEVEGSKALVFTGEGLSLAWKKLSSQKRYVHYDLFLSRALKSRKYYRTRKSHFGSRVHDSIPLSKGGVTKKRPAHRVTW